jgi:UDP-4-amino-4,6-dideoxy-N-acetyl-beta-L-altrosamine N-acetyltransferase
MAKESGMLRPMEDGDLEQILQWRNHPNISRYMYTKHLISLEEHRAWFERVSVDQTRRLLVYEKEGQRLGYVQFSGIQENGSAYWGIYAAINAPKGTGRELGRAALTYGFDHLLLHKISSQVIEFNERSVVFHLSVGFVKEGLLREQFFDGIGHHSVVCFGLLRNDWRRDE